MGVKRSGDNERHRASAEVLPWYVNGTLGVVEASDVAAHLGECAECREQVEFWQRLAPQMARSDAGATPHPAQFRRLLERLDDDVEPASEPARRPTQRRLPVGWRWVVALQATAIVGLVGIGLVGRRAPAPPTFHVLAAPAESAAGLRLRVVFDEGLTERELRGLLVPLGAAIVAGPSPLGVYTIELAAGSSAEAAAALRARPLVRFVEPLVEPGGGRR